MSGPWDNYQPATPAAAPAAPQSAPWLKYQTPGVARATGGPGGAAKAPVGSARRANGSSLAQTTDFASSGSGTPVQKAMAAQTGPISPIDDPRMLPKIEATAVASLPTNPAAKALYLATKIFPDRAPGDALARMGFDGQRLYYIANDGKAYFAEPKFDMSTPGKTMAEIPDLLASGIGPAMPTIGGMAGGIAGGPTPASVIPAAGFGMLGDSLRQAGAKYFTGETQNWLDSAKELLGEGAMQGANQALGLGVGGVAGKIFNRNPLKVAGYDINKMTPARLAEIQANSDLANSMGITVTPGEAGDVMSLLINQRQLGRQPEGASALADFYKNRNINQIPEAWVQYLDTVSPQASSAVANRDLGEAAGDVIKSQIASRSGKATGLYTEAFDANAAVRSPRIAQIIDTPAGKQALSGVLTDMRNGLANIDPADPKYGLLKDEIDKINAIVNPQPGASPATPDLGMRTYDLVKQKLYDLEQAAKGEHGASTLSSKYIGNLRTALTNELDNADVTAGYDPATGSVVPGKYAQARKMFETNSPPVTDLQKGIVGLVAKDKPNALQNLPKTLLSATSSDPFSIAQARAAFQRAGKMDEWNAATRSFLQNTFADAVKQGGKTGPAYSLWKSIAGDTRQLANLKAALGPSQFEGLQNMMKVTEMVSRALGEGAPTATDLGSRASFASPLAKATSKVVRNINPLDIPKNIAAKIEDISAGNNVAGLVDAITNPNAVRSLKRLRTLPPGGKAWIKELGYLGGVLGWSTAGPALDPQAPMAPGTIPAGAQ